MATMRELINYLNGLEKCLVATWHGDQSQGLCRRELSLEDNGQIGGYVAAADDSLCDFGRFSVKVLDVVFTKDADERLGASWETDAELDAGGEDFDTLRNELEAALDAHVRARTPDFESFTDYEWTRSDIEDALNPCCGGYALFCADADGNVYAFEEEPEELAEGLQEIDTKEAADLLEKLHLDWSLDY